MYNAWDDKLIVRIGFVSKFPTAPTNTPHDKHYPLNLFFLSFFFSFLLAKMENVPPP
jgi:hypothetical protein